LGVLAQEAGDITVTVPEIACGLFSLAFCSWYYAARFWFANNLLGLAFSIQGIEHLSLGAVSTGASLLGGLCFRVWSRLNAAAASALLGNQTSLTCWQQLRARDSNRCHACRTCLGAPMARGHDFRNTTNFVIELAVACYAAQASFCCVASFSTTSSGFSSHRSWSRWRSPSMRPSSCCSPASSRMHRSRCDAKALCSWDYTSRDFECQSSGRSAASPRTH
jgi:Signal peptide peptidase